MKDFDTIKVNLQSSLDDGCHDYTLKTNEELIDSIIEFGSGQLEFHTADIERLIKENKYLKDKINSVYEVIDIPEKFRGKMVLVGSMTDAEIADKLQESTITATVAINKLSEYFEALKVNSKKEKTHTNKHYRRHCNKSKW